VTVELKLIKRERFSIGDDFRDVSEKQENGLETHFGESQNVEEMCKELKL
jgi:hypothetical protein